MINEYIKKLYHVLIFLLSLFPLLTPSAVGANPTSEWDKTEFTAVRIISAQHSIGDSYILSIGLEFKLEPGWKIYWRSPGDAGSPPSLNFEGSENLNTFQIHWPSPQRFFEAANLETVGYLKTVVIPITIDLISPNKRTVLNTIIDYQACKTICIPIQAKLRLALPEGSGEDTAYFNLIKKYREMVPVTLGEDPIILEKGALNANGDLLELILNHPKNEAFDNPILFVEGPAEVRFTKAKKNFREHRKQAIFQIPVETVRDATLINQTITVTLIDKNTSVEFSTYISPSWQTEKLFDVGSLLAILSLALLGGLILNVMPCVLPVLAIKVLGVIQHAEQNNKEIRVHFLSTASGIICSFVLLAAGAIVLKAAGVAVGWGMQFQEPLFLIFLTLIVTIFASNLFGFFEVPIPSWVGGNMVLTSRFSISNSFWSGALATLLATPCSAPFLGTAVGFALIGGPIQIILIFTTLGVGMALPYLILSVVPTFAGYLPRPGKWMNTVRALLGLILLVTAAWLLLVISAQIGLLGASLLAALMVICVLFLGLASQTKEIGAKITASGVIVLSLLSFTIPHMVPPKQPMIGGHFNSEGPWKPLDVLAIPGHIDHGKIVFVDITADWCLTCKINKSLVLDRQVIGKALGKSDVILMQGDWTNSDPNIAAYLTNFGRYGLPFDAIYGPGAPNGIVLPELLSVSSVLKTLQQIRGASEANTIK